MELHEYLATLRALCVGYALVIVTILTNMVRRVLAFAEAGTDAVLNDGLANLDVMRDLSTRVSCSFAFNQLACGKSPAYTKSELKEAGMPRIIYSTPCLFVTAKAIEAVMIDLNANEGKLSDKSIAVSVCNNVLKENVVEEILVNNLYL